MVPFLSEFELQMNDASFFPINFSPAIFLLQYLHKCECLHFIVTYSIVHSIYVYITKKHLLIIFNYYLNWFPIFVLCAKFGVLGGSKHHPLQEFIGEMLLYENYFIYTLQ